MTKQQFIEILQKHLNKNKPIIINGVAFCYDEYQFWQDDLIVFYNRNIDNELEPICNILQKNIKEISEWQTTTAD